jgi:histidine triad (HIT) family protein
VNDTTCLFCRIARKEIPAAVVFEDEAVLAFRDIAPKAPTHVVVIPKVHVERLAHATEKDDALLGRLLRTVAHVAAQEGLKDYRVAVNNGAGAGQSVFHLHLHLLGGRSFSWPPG